MPASSAGPGATGEGPVHDWAGADGAVRSDERKSSTKPRNPSLLGSSGGGEKGSETLSGARSRHFQQYTQYGIHFLCY